MVLSSTSPFLQLAPWPYLACQLSIYRPYHWFPTSDCDTTRPLFHRNCLHSQKANNFLSCRYSKTQESRAGSHWFRSACLKSVYTSLQMLDTSLFLFLRLLAIQPNSCLKVANLSVYLNPFYKLRNRSRSTQGRNSTTHQAGCTSQGRLLLVSHTSYCEQIPRTFFLDRLQLQVYLSLATTFSSFHQAHQHFNR